MVCMNATGTVPEGINFCHRRITMIGRNNEIDELKQLYQVRR